MATVCDVALPDPPAACDAPYFGIITDATIEALWDEPDDR